MTHGVNSTRRRLTWFKPDASPAAGTVYPSVGAVVSLFKGYEPATRINSAYIVLTEPQGRFLSGVPGFAL